MNKKVFTLLVMALLAVIGAKADVIPSNYYSEPAAGIYYIYNVTEGKFLRTVGVNENNYNLLDAPVAVTLSAKGETVCKGGGDYILSGNTDNFIKIGHWGGQWLWSNAASGNTDILAWTFNSNGTKTYTMSVTFSEAFTQNNVTLAAGTHYMKGVTNLGSEAEAGTYALITEADYYAYLASTTMIPSTYYTTTPAAGTYYLYNIERNGFIYRGGDGNYAGLKNIPAALTLTLNGAGAFYIKFGDETKYLKTGEYNGYYVWTDATDESFAWTFESFHGVAGLFLVKCPLNDVDRYLYSSSIGVRGVNAWTAPDANKTQYAWALISVDDYTAWQNSYVLSDANMVGFSATTDIYNVNPTVSRAMTANIWNTLVVPFDMAVPLEWTVVEPTSFSDGTLTFNTVSSIVAGKPYLVKPTANVSNIPVTGVTLKKDLTPTTVGDLTMTGTYSLISAVPEGSYVLGTDNNLHKVNSTVSLKPFRAYFTIAGSSSAKERISLNFADDASAIQQVEVASTTDCVYYNLAGQRVTAPTKGIYIVNGKKILVK